MPKKYSDVITGGGEWVRASDLVDWEAIFYVLTARKRERTGGLYPGEEIVFKIVYILPGEKKDAAKTAQFSLSATPAREEIADLYARGYKDKVGPMQVVKGDYQGREVYNFRDYDPNRPAEPVQPKLEVSDDDIPF